MKLHRYKYSNKSIECYQTDSNHWVALKSIIETFGIDEEMIKSIEKQLDYYMTLITNENEIPELATALGKVVSLNELSIFLYHMVYTGSKKEQKESQAMIEDFIRILYSEIFGDQQAIFELLKESRSIQNKLKMLQTELEDNFLNLPISMHQDKANSENQQQVSKISLHQIDQLRLFQEITCLKKERTRIKRRLNEWLRVS